MVQFLCVNHQRIVNEFLLLVLLHQKLNVCVCVSACGYDVIHPLLPSTDNHISGDVCRGFVCDDQARKSLPHYSSPEACLPN